MNDLDQLRQRLKTLFGVHVDIEGPLLQSGAVVRFTGIDLCGPLNEGQAGFLLDALS
ncbi:MAG: hypothetical protein HN521_24595, partial [Candidatus Latescibacteria bacterium]|nr:hypothetical protein [Candidatus Latescibacterota bacterium]